MSRHVVSYCYGRRIDGWPLGLRGYGVAFNAMLVRNADTSPILILMIILRLMPTLKRPLPCHPAVLIQYSLQSKLFYSLVGTAHLQVGTH
jgi:hypothetical protein